MSGVRDEADILAGLEELWEEGEESQATSPEDAAVAQLIEDDGAELIATEPAEDEAAPLTIDADDLDPSKLFEDGGDFDEDSLLAQLQSEGASFDDDEPVAVSTPTAPAKAKSGGGKGTGKPRTPSAPLPEAQIRQWWANGGKNEQKKATRAVNLAKQFGLDVNQTTKALEMLGEPMVYQAVRAAMVSAGLHTSTPRGGGTGGATGIPTKQQQAPQAFVAPPGMPSYEALVENQRKLVARFKDLEARVKELEGSED